MECPNGCPTPLKTEKQEKIFHRNGEPVVISDLEVNVCPQCGQETIPLPSARSIENILSGKVKPSGKFTAELYEVSATV